MTPLKVLILSLLYKHGPMRDVELWQKTTEVAITPITFACLDLESEKLIEVPRGIRPTSHEWQLTTKGREVVEQQLQQKQEVSH